MDLCGEIDKRSRVLTEDNFDAFVRHVESDPSHFYTREHLYHLIVSAMTIGASIVVERGGPDPIPGEIPDEVFGRAALRARG
jgi:hypothetical protein